MHACMYVCITAHPRERLARRCRRRRRGRRRAVGRRRRELRACGRPHAHSLLRPHCHTIAQHNLPSTRARAQSFALRPAQAQARTGDRVHRQAHARGHRHTRLEDRHTNASPHTHTHTHTRTHTQASAPQERPSCAGAACVWARRSAVCAQRRRVAAGVPLVRRGELDVVPAQMWFGVSPVVPVQMWAAVRPVPAQMSNGTKPSPVPAQRWQG